MLRKKKQIKVICSKCGKEPEKNQKNSNNNWTVIDNKLCVYCGGKLTCSINIK